MLSLSACRLVNTTRTVEGDCPQNSVDFEKQYLQKKFRSRSFQRSKVSKRLGLEMQEGADCFSKTCFSLLWRGSYIPVLDILTRNWQSIVIEIVTKIKLLLT